MSSAAGKGSSPSVIVILGHSIANGVGATDTTYGGASVAAGVTFRDSGTTRATYPSSAGAGPDPGVVPYHAATLAALGGGTIIRRSTNGQILGGVEATELPGSIADCTALGIDRSSVKLVILMIGENDAQDSTEAGAYAARIAQTCDLVERAYPNARVVIQDMATENGSYSQYATIRAANSAAAALRSTRAVASYAGIGFNDAVHYSLAGYTTAAAAQWTAYGLTA